MFKNYTSMVVGMETQLRKECTTAGLSSNKWLLSMMLLFGMFITGFKASAQVSSLMNPTYGYTFLNTTSTYTALSGGTVYQSGTTINTDAVSSVITLPFVFTYNGIKEKTIFISNNGFITFGSAPATSNYVPISTTTTSGYDGAIAGFALNAVASTASGASADISYGTNAGGDFVVQYKDIAQTGAAAGRMTFQIVLKVDGKTVQIVYGPNNAGLAGTSVAQVGLRGTNQQDWNIRTIGNTGDWNTSGGSAGTSNTDGMGHRAAAVLPTSGRTFQWSPTTYTPTYLANAGGVVQEFTAWTNGPGLANVPTVNFGTNGYGNASWQIDNTTATTTTSGWTGTSGAYSPVDYVSASGGHSARFHSFNATSPQVGYLDYYVDLSGITGTPTVDFYSINPTGTDILQVFLSTNGGSTFTQIGSNIGTSTSWTARSISLGATNSATTIIRFKATSDFGNDDIGIDHLVVTPPPALPTITGFTPTSNLCINGGQTVTITGTNFSGTSSVKFNSVNAASFTVVNSTTITAVTPATLSSGTITVTNPAGTATSGAYTAVANPTVAVSPTSATFCTGGTPVTLTASGASTYAWAGTGTPVLSASTGNPVTASPTTNTTITVTGTDANGCTNTATAVVTPSATPSAPTTTPYSICVAGTVPGGQGLISSLPSITGGSQTVNFTVSAQPTETNAAPGNTVASATMAALPAGATVTSITLSYPNLTALSSSWRADIRLGLSGAIVNAAAVDPLAANSAGTLNYTRTASTGITATNAGGTVNLLYWDNADDNVSAAEATFPTGANVATLTINYSYPATIDWYTASTGGTSIGTGTPFNPVGVAGSGLADTNTPGTYTFYAAASNNGSCPSARTSAIFTVSSGAAITADPSPTTKCVGQTATFTATASGPSLTYQWMKNGVDIAVGGNASAGTPTLSLTNVTAADAATYSVRVSSTCGSPATSLGALLTVNALPIVAVTPTTGTFCSPGGTPITLTASGASTYAWAGTGTPVLSATTGNPVTSSPTTATVITVTGTDGNGCTNTATASLTVAANPSGVTATATPSTICSGATSSLTGTGGVPFTVKNYSFVASIGSLDPMTGATTIITSPAVGSGVGDDTPSSVQTFGSGFTFNYEGTNYTQYSISPDGWLMLGNGTASASFSNSTTSSTNVPKIYPLWDDLSTGTNGNVKVVVNGTAPNRIFVAQWLVTNPRVIANAANATFQAWLYEGSNKIEFRYGAVGTSSSASVGLTGATSTNFNSVSFSTNTASTSSANDTNTTAPASGTLYTFTPPSLVTYAWTSPTTTVVSPSNATTLTAPLAATETFTFTVSNGTCSAQATTTVTISSGAAITTDPSATAKCVGQTATFTVTATGPSLTYQWRKGGVNINTGTNASAATATLSLANVTAADIDTYDVVVSSTCGSPATSAGATLTVTTPLASITTPSATICTGDSVTLTENGGNATSWSWSPGAATTQAITVSPVATTTYTVTATVNGCSATANQTITVNPKPAAVSITPSSASICSGSSVGLVASGGGVTVNSIYSASAPTLSLAIPDNTGAAAIVNANPSTIPVGATISKVEVTYSITHTFSGDVEVSLKAPNGKIVNLMADRGGSSGLGFTNTVATSDTSASAFSTGSNPFTGTFKADLTASTSLVASTNIVNTQVFSDLFTTPNGTWSILFYDDAGTDTGTVTSASIKIYYTASSPASFTWTPLSSGLNTYSGASVTASPLTDTTYTATSTVNGCTSFSNVTVTVKPLPTLTISGAITPACAATTADLTSVVSSNGSVAYFSDNGYSVSVGTPTAVTTAGTYYIRATLNGCTLDGTVLVNPFRANPTLSVSGAITPACGATTADLNSVVTTNGTATYFSDNGYSVSVATPTAVTVAGTYYVRATLNGCTTDGSVLVNAFRANPVVTASDVSGCSGTSISLIGSPVGGTFSVANPYVGTTSTTYTYSYTAPNGCSVTSAPANITITAQPLWYLDADGDHYYTGSAVPSCTSPGTGYTMTVTGGGDCNDANAAINPGAAEICYNNIDDNCGGTLSDGCAPVIVNMTPSYNNTTLPSLAIAVPAVAYTYPGTSNIKYRFKITNITAVPALAPVEVIQTSRYITIPASLHSYNAQYTITVSAVINDEVVAYAGNTITVNSPTVQLVTLNSATCGATLATLASTLTANPGLNATGYTFRIRLNDSNPSPTYYTSQSATRFVSANSFTGFPLQYSTSYKVSVQYTFTDPVTSLPVDSGYGSECVVNTPSIPLTSLASPTCGSQVATMNANISASAASYATGYQFRIRLFGDNGPTPTYYYSVPNASRFSSLTAFQGITFAYNTAYSISVQYSILNGATTVWSGYGSECKVTTPFFPVTSLIASQCGLATPTALTQQLNITPYPGFPNYKVKLEEVSGEDIVNSEEIIVTYSYFRLNQFSIAQPGKNYNVSVAIKINGVFGDYDTACDLFTAPLAKTNATVSFKATAYPNPFANNFMLDVKTSSQSSVNFKVYDMVGRLIEQRNVNVSDMETVTIGDQYPTGVYNVVVSQEDSVQTVRVVKR